MWRFRRRLKRVPAVKKGRGAEAALPVAGGGLLSPAHRPEPLAGERGFIPSGGLLLWPAPGSSPVPCQTPLSPAHPRPGAVKPARGPTGANQPALIAWLTAVVRAGWPGPKPGCKCSAWWRRAKFRAVKPPWCPFCLGSVPKVVTPEGRGRWFL